LSSASLLPALLLAQTPAMEPAPVAPVATAPAPVAETLPEPAPAAVAPAVLPDAPPAPAPAARPGYQEGEGDPMEGFNRRMFRIHDGIDRALFRPLAMGYKTAVPKPARDGLRNVIGNLTEPIVFLNYLLQFKFGKAAETLARFTLNSTVGVGGLIDVANDEGIDLPHRHNGLGNTLAYYGVKSGPYLFLPFIGPTTLRDILSTPVDGSVLPVAVGYPFDRLDYQLSSGLVSGLGERVEADAELKSLFATAVDPYATLRSVWLQDRTAEIAALKGKTADPLDS